MAWQTECVLILRHLIDDLDCDNYKYTNRRLEELLIVAAQFVNVDVSLRQEYTIDADQLTLTPDPTDRSARDESFVNLMILKAACILERAEARKASGRAVALSDSFGTKVDLTGNLQGALALLKNGYCNAYSEAKLEYALDNMAVVGAAIMSPFRSYAYNSHYESDPFR